MSVPELFFRRHVRVDTFPPISSIKGDFSQISFWTPYDLSAFDRHKFLPADGALHWYYQYYKNSLPVVRRKIDNFIHQVEYSGHYDSFERDLILRANILATVAHQFNRKEEKRIRKSDGSPYIFHSLEMAERLVKDGFDWLTVAATLLHDVPEDVDLGRGLKGKKVWIDVIRREFNLVSEANGVIVGINKDRKAGDLLVQLIEGVTEKDFDFNIGGRDRGELDRISEGALFKIIKAYVERGGLINPKDLGRSISIEERNAIAAVTYNLEKIFEAALQSPDHWRIFIIKIADIWQNYQTIDFVKPAKILRGKIAANLAEWMGWYEMRSAIISLLAEETDTTATYSPDLGDKIPPSQSDSRVEKDIMQLKTDAFFIIDRLFSRSQDKALKRAEVFAGWPVLCNFDYRMLYHYGHSWRSPGAYDKTSLPIPEVIIKIDDLQDRDLSENFRTRKWLGWMRIPRPHLKSGAASTNFGVYQTTVSQFVRNAFGRERYDYKVSIGNEASFTLRLEDNSQPHIIDLFRNNASVRPEMIPEVGLFNNLFKDIDIHLWRYHLERLISLFYELDTPFARGDKPSEVYVMSYKGNLFLINGRNISWKDLTGKFGETLEDEVEITDLRGNKNTVSTVRPIITHLSYAGDSMSHRLEILK